MMTDEVVVVVVDDKADERGGGVFITATRTHGTDAAS